MTSPEPTGSDSGPVETNPLGNVLCFVVVAVPVWMACGIGAAGLGATLDLPLASLALTTLTVGLGAGMGVLVAQWRARANPKAWHHLLFLAVLGCGGSFFFTYPGSPVDVEMWLTIHTSSSELFGEREEMAVGDVVAFGGGENRVPPGWMVADGRALARADYPELSKRLGTTFGGDDQTVRLPRLERLHSPDIVRLYERLARGTDQMEPRGYEIETRLSVAPPPDADEEERRMGEVLWLVRVEP